MTARTSRKSGPSFLLRTNIDKKRLRRMLWKAQNGKLFINCPADTVGLRLKAFVNCFSKCEMPKISGQNHSQFMRPSAKLFLRGGELRSMAKWRMCRSFVVAIESEQREILAWKYRKQKLVPLSYMRVECIRQPRINKSGKDVDRKDNNLSNCNA